MSYVNRVFVLMMNNPDIRCETLRKQLFELRIHHVSAAVVIECFQIHY